jgi:hypothetical protein
VAGFLTAEWFEDLDEAGRAAELATDTALVIQQVIPDGPGGTELTYVIAVADGAVRVRKGRASSPDVTFTQDLATATAIHDGVLSAQTAFIEGRLRLGGDLRAVIERAGSLAAIDDVFAAARA